jgi:hypothetical protein
VERPRPPKAGLSGIRDASDSTADCWEVRSENLPNGCDLICESELLSDVVFYFHVYML